jgi:hypothetical protein
MQTTPLIWSLRINSIDLHSKHSWHTTSEPSHWVVPADPAETRLVPMTSYLRKQHYAQTNIALPQFPMPKKLSYDMHIALKHGKACVHSPTRSCPFLHTLSRV